MVIKEIRLILGDQLHVGHSWFHSINPEVLYLMMEVRSETDYVSHHIQKVVAFFAAMRAFAANLSEEGHQVLYLKLDDSRNQQSFGANLKWVLDNNPGAAWAYQMPDEYRLDQLFVKLNNQLKVFSRQVDSEHFLCERKAVKDFFVGKKQYLLESFYRHLRKQTGLLMQGSKPLGGKWNFDAENRKKYDGQVPLPPRLKLSNRVDDLVQLVREAGVETIGLIHNNELEWPINRLQSLRLLEHFCKYGLPYFGSYQDALTEKDPFLFHSRLSFALNVKLLHPREVLDRVVQEWEGRPDQISLAQVEGFVRQILGWREYIRGIYWAEMPSYSESNTLKHQLPLPSWFWTGKTRMRCLSHSIKQSLEYAYAHHIQRLMVTGNFALLAGIAPEELDKWYLGIYIDAIEWVELPNTRGMSQFADGGLLATKPYVSSANYLRKMGHYCEQCPYDAKSRHDTLACPFNSLYWEFHDRHREKLGRNPRIGMVYRTWDKMDSREQSAIRERAHWLKEHLEEL
jgi:deoxyribodipyrimidine photolyase-related protein